MLSIGVAKADYYLEQVTRSLEGYYLNGEAPGCWLGRGAERLGLAGRVEHQPLLALFGGKNPATGEGLCRFPTKVPGLDLTFRAPKSVSLLHALGGDDVARAVAAAHEAAVRGALVHLEAEACRVRRGAGGADVLPAGGFVGASFSHSLSREADPHLHTHVVVANMAEGPDGRFSALDARALFGWAKTAGTLYEAQLRSELTSRLGVEWGPVRNGIADLAGVPRQLITTFSRRRSQILDEMARTGATSARAAQIATLATRPAKDPDLRIEDLLPEWRARAQTLGWDRRAFAGLVGRAGVAPVPTPKSVEAEALFARLAGPEGLTRRASSFGRREVLQAVAAALPTGASVTSRPWPPPSWALPTPSRWAARPGAAGAT